MSKALPKNEVNPDEMPLQVALGSSTVGACLTESMANPSIRNKRCRPGDESHRLEMS